jgi:hypothetical protein
VISSGPAAASFRQLVASLAPTSGNASTQAGGWDRMSVASDFDHSVICPTFPVIVVIAK